jgi:hypothetical protein
MNRLLLLILLVACSAQLNAQSFFRLSNWEIAKVNLHFGKDEDMLKDMHQDYFLSMVKDDKMNFNYSDLDFTNTDMYSMICENPNIRLEASLESPYFKNTEWRIGMNAIINRIDAITYFNGDYNYYGNSDYLNFNSVGNEMSIESAVLKTLPIGSRLSLQGGVGANIGYSYGNRLDIWGSSRSLAANTVNYTNVGEVSEIISNQNYEYHFDNYELRDGVSQRAYLIAGANIRILRRLELGFDVRRGYGYRAIFGAPMASTHLKAFSLSAKYNFRMHKPIPFLKSVEIQ